jgi:hypothetical protein
MEQNKLLSKLKNSRLDILFITLIFLLSLFFLRNCIGTGTLMDNVHHYHEQTLFSYNYKSAFENGTLPLWTPYWYSGQDIFGDSQFFFVNLTFIFTLLFKNIFLAIELSNLLYLFIAGLGMYLLVRYLIDSREAAFISAILFMFNGLIISFVAGGNPSILEPYALIPLIFLFILKAKKSENPVNYAVLAGILFTLQIFSGGALMLVYAALPIGLYLALDLISAKFKTNLIKTAIIGIVILAVFFGLSAIKLLPNFDYVEKTNRAEGVSYEEYIGADKFIFKDSINVFLTDKATPSTRAHIGILASLLVLVSLLLWRKKVVMYLALISIFALVLASGGILAKLFYDYFPTFSQTRHIGRILFVFVFSASILAAYGFTYIKDYATKKFNISKNMAAAGTAIVILIILTELVFLKGIPNGFDMQKQLEENQAAKYLSQQKEKFRIASFDVTDIIGFHGSSYYSIYGLETISGGGGLWVNDFVNYIAIAKNYNYSKLMGILNMEYGVSTKEVNIDGFKLVKIFEECASCQINDAKYFAGPYLYENEDFVPRYILVNNAILVVGESKNSQEFIYSILLNNNFDPKTTVIIHEDMGNIASYSVDDLLKFNTIMLLESPKQDEITKLQGYRNKGGKLVPDIFNDETILTQESLVSALSADKWYKEISQTEYSTNKRAFELNKENGWLVLSERFADFPEWKASINGENLKIYKADNVISAVYLDSKEGILKFDYMPRSFKTGRLITILTAIILLAYLIIIVYLKKWKKSA